jgi:hypothetical protein
LVTVRRVLIVVRMLLVGNGRGTVGVDCGLVCI